MKYLNQVRSCSSFLMLVDKWVQPWLQHSFMWIRYWLPLTSMDEIMCLITKKVFFSNDMLFPPVFRCILAFFHVYKKKRSFLIVVYIWPYRKHLTYNHDVYVWLLCGYWSSISADSFLQVSRRLEVFSGVSFFFKMIHNFWFFHLWNQNFDPSSKLFSLGLI